MEKPALLLVLKQSISSGEEVKLEFPHMRSLSVTAAHSERCVGYSFFGSSIVHFMASSTTVF